MTPDSPADQARPRWSLELTLTTATVVLVAAGVMFWLVREPGWRSALTILGGLALYLGVLVTGMRTTHGAVGPFSAFAGAGLFAGIFVQAIHGHFRVSSDLGLAALTGAFIGSAHYIAIHLWRRAR